MLKKIRFATIGSNAIVDSFLRGAAHDERFEHAAVYSRTLERGEMFAVKHNVSKIYTSIEELSEDKMIDAVYIATPNVCHCPQAILMMNHGKHVLCEKPMAPSVSEALSMIEAAKRNNVALMEAMKTTLLPNFFSVRDSLPKIGKVHRFFAQFCQYSSRYDKFLLGEVDNVFNPAMKGGALLDLGVYGIAPLIHLFGVPSDVRKSEVRMFPGGIAPRAIKSIVSGDNGSDIDVQGTLLLNYPDMEAVVMYSKICDSSLPLEIQGEKGSILVHKLSQMTSPVIKYRPQLSSRRPGEPALKYDETITEDISVPTLDDNMYYELREFINIILEHRIESEENTFERTLDVLRVCEGGR